MMTTNTRSTMTKGDKPGTYDSTTHRVIRDRGIEGMELDESKLRELGRRVWRERNKEADAGVENTIDVGPMPMGLYDTLHGYMIVNGEGVHGCTDTEGMIDVYFSNGWTWFWLECNIEDVLDCVIYPSTNGEPQWLNLADNVRTFGDRLERNFSLAWHKAL
jgi:hypothetical protein